MSTSLLAAARYRLDLLAAARLSGTFSHSHALGDENVRKSPGTPGNPPVSAILTGGENEGGVRMPPAPDSRDSHADENAMRIVRTSPVACAQCGALSGAFIEVVNPGGWECRACRPDAAELRRRRDLADAMAARAEAMTGIMEAEDVLADRAAVLAVDG